MKKLILTLFTIILLTSCNSSSVIEYPIVIKEIKITTYNPERGKYFYTIKGINKYHKAYFYSNIKFNIGDTIQ